MDNIINTTTTQQPTETKEEFRIELSKPFAFDATAETKITSTKDLGYMINDVFKAAFEDYYGCSLNVQFQPELRMNILVPKLYFRVLKDDAYQEGKIYGFKTIGAANNNNLIGRVMRVTQSAMPSAKVEITPEAKQMLDEFMLKPSHMRFDWNSTFNIIASDTESYVAMFKLDIVKLVAKLFGEYDENDKENKLFYQVTPTYAKTPNQMYKAPDDWALNIVRLNSANQAHAAELVGMTMPTVTGGLNVITGTSKK